MKAIIKPSFLNGEIKAPASKSSMQRACACALLTNGTTIISNAGHSDDDKAALDIIQQLGAKVTFNKETLEIQSNGIINPINDEINCGESGLSTRMFTPIVALSNKKVTINGHGSLLTRPMNFFDEILPKLNVKIKTNNGKLPFVIQGPLEVSDIEIDGSLSSQFLTGLILAYATSQNTSIKVKNLKSKPYIDLTLEVMKKFGITLPQNKDYEEFVFCDPKNKQVTNTYYSVEGDWSGSAFIMAAAAINRNGPKWASVGIKELSLISTQADKKFFNALINAKADIYLENKDIILSESEMKAFEFDATDCPDLFPPLVALACYCQGVTKIKGISRLTHKESNRAITLQEEFAKMNVKIVLDDDMMMIYGGGLIKGNVVDSRNDHRIAMALTVAALNAEGETILENAESVNKSYPDFFTDLIKLNARVSLV